VYFLPNVEMSKNWENWNSCKTRQAEKMENFGINANVMQIFISDGEKWKSEGEN